MDEFRKRAYKLWSNIKARCYNKKHISYRSYGAKGAKVCDRWLNSFEHFLEDIQKVDGFNYEKFCNGELQMDKDLKQQYTKNKIYSLSTCTFLTQEENIKLQDSGKDFYVVTPKGDISKEKSIKKYCDNHNIPHSHAMAMWRGDKTRKTVKGYQFFKEKPSEKDILKPRVYKGTSPTGEEILFYRYDSLEHLGHNQAKVRSAIKNKHLTKDGWRFIMVSDGYRLTKKQEEDLIDNNY